MKGEKYAGELIHLRILVETLNDRLANMSKKLEIASSGYHTMWDLWCREVRPGWRMWRIKRRRTATEKDVT